MSKVLQEQIASLEATNAVLAEELRQAHDNYQFAKGKFLEVAKAQEIRIAELENELTQYRQAP